LTRVLVSLIVGLPQARPSSLPRTGYPLPEQVLRKPPLMSPLPRELRAIIPITSSVDRIHSGPWQNRIRCRPRRHSRSDPLPYLPPFQSNPVDISRSPAFHKMHPNFPPAPPPLSRFSFIRNTRFFLRLKRGDRRSFSPEDLSHRSPSLRHTSFFFPSKRSVTPDSHLNVVTRYS